MSVKPIRSAARVLAALEVIARHQPIGVAELARRLGEDKSNVQRVLVTLASSGWIKALPDSPKRWELTTRLLAVASYAQGTAGLGQLIRPRMLSLRDRTEETVICAVPDGDRVVITDVVESTQVVRSAPPVGLVVPTETSASGRALLAAMDRPARVQLAGHDLSDAEHSELDAIQRRGWSLNADDAAGGLTNVGDCGDQRQRSSRRSARDLRGVGASAARRAAKVRRVAHRRSRRSAPPGPLAESVIDAAVTTPPLARLVTLPR